MRAVRIQRHGGPEALEVVEVPEPHPGPGEVAVRLGAIGVNFIDIYHREGLYPLSLPTTLGTEGAGTVIEVGDGVEEFSIGDRVAFANQLGSYAEVICIPAARAVPVPPSLSIEQAAAVLLQGMTVHALAISCARIKPGSVTVVHAAAGGVGSLLVQFLVRKLAATVIATASTPDKRERARSLGAQVVTDYVDVVEAARSFGGATVVFDGVGAATFDASLAALAPRGMLVLYGQASGPVAPIDPQELNRRGSLFLTRPSLVHYVETTAELRWRAQSVFADVEAGTLEVTVGARFPLDAAADAQQALAARATVGKVLLLP
jgi:NADPH2:quinone reductase